LQTPGTWAFAVQTGRQTWNASLANQLPLLPGAPSKPANEFARRSCAFAFEKTRPPLLPGNPRPSQKGGGDNFSSTAALSFVIFLVPVVFFDCAKLGIDDFHREKKSASFNFFHIATNAQDLGCSLSSSGLLCALDKQSFSLCREASPPKHTNFISKPDHQFLFYNQIRLISPRISCIEAPWSELEVRRQPMRLLVSFLHRQFIILFFRCLHRRPDGQTRVV
jgi:hypothetical protein